MTISAGIGIANFTFDDAKGFWEWVDLCDSGGVDSIWQSDRIIGGDDNLECMSVMAALAGATKRIKFARARLSASACVRLATLPA